ncbi:MAG: peptide deformylase [Eubacteriales bacterium]|jgi:peptide deformylase|nr:peptide deformylase [Eubacteriales bacterium]NCC81211.1 peptide deformylase [Clostridia bacterium]
MGIYKIVTKEDPLLRKQSKIVKEVDDKIIKIIDDMFETMYTTDTGVGLAAPQVGILKQIIVIDTQEEEPFALINPEIVSSEGEVDSEEGCLSCPEEYGFVKRAEKVKVKALNEKGEEIEIDAEGFLAIVLQHEIDHLKGVLFIDKATPREKE